MLKTLLHCWQHARKHEQTYIICEDSGLAFDRFVDILFALSEGRIRLERQGWTGEQDVSCCAAVYSDL